jgi:ABC-2 type transport system permease protein
MSAKERTSYAYPTSVRLFTRRLISHWREQSAIIRTAADWTVLLYIIIPGGLLGGRLYYGYWNQPLPSWSTALPFIIIPILFVILLSTGGLLLLVQEGDLLFLRQRQSWLKSIMVRGIVYSLVVTTVKITTAFGLLLPFMMRGYGLTGEAVLSLFIMTIACSWCIKLLGHIVRVQRQSWRRWVWQIPAVGMPCSVYLRVALLWNTYPPVLWITAFLFAAGAVWAIRYRLSMRGTFMNDVREDYKQRMKIAGLLLRGVLDKPRPTRYKPWVFRKSERLLSSRLPESRLSAAAIKAFIRNPGHLKLYLQFTAVSVIAVFIVPPLLKWLVLVVLTSLMTYWLFSFWSFFVKDDYIGLLPFTKEQKAEAGSRAVPILLIPFTVICSALACFQLYAWWGLLFFIPAGAAAGIMISRIFGTFSLER